MLGQATFKWSTTDVSVHGASPDLYTPILTFYSTAQIPSVRLSDHKPVKALFHIPTPSLASSHLSTRPPYPMDPSRSVKQIFGLFLGRLIGTIWSILRTFGLGNAWIGAALILLHIAAMAAQFDYVNYAWETLKWAKGLDLKYEYDDLTKKMIGKISDYLDYSSEVYLSHK